MHRYGPFAIGFVRQGVEPEQRLVVEDSVLGVKAGPAAGMAVLGYPGAKTAAPLEQIRARVFLRCASCPSCSNASKINPFLTNIQL